jgi:hypothetical protein
MPVRGDDTPSSRRAPSSPHGSTNDGIARSRNFRTDPPPELDGTKRKRVYTYFFAAFAIAAAVIAVSVYRSQLRVAPAAQPQVTPPPGPAPVEPPVVTTAMPTLTAAPAETPAEDAVDPGKLKHPISSAKPPAPRGTFKKRKKPSDGTVDIPDPPDDE